MTPDLIEDVSRAILSAAGLIPDRHEMARAAIAAINESGTHRVVLVCPDDGNILADDGVCGFCGNAALKGGEE